MAPYGMLQDAINAGDLKLVLRVSRQLGGRVRLDDALRIVLLYRDRDPEQYDRAAIRWLGRFALEARGLTIEDLREALDALDQLPEFPDAAMDRLERVCGNHWRP